MASNIWAQRKLWRWTCLVHIRARATSDLHFTVGETVGVTFETNRLSVFDAETGNAIKTVTQKEAARV